MRILILVSFACVCIAAGDVRAQHCLAYEPETVTLEGNVSSKDFPGPPNFESIRGGDQRIRYWILRLPQSVCVDGGHDDINVRVENIREIQLVFEDDAFYKKYRALVRKHKHFQVVGSLFHEHTANHVRKILFKVQRFVPLSLNGRSPTLLTPGISEPHGTQQNNSLPGTPFVLASALGFEL
jgi:hypothetical protein